MNKNYSNKGFSREPIGVTHDFLESLNESKPFYYPHLFFQSTRVINIHNYKGVYMYEYKAFFCNECMYEKRKCKNCFTKNMYGFSIRDILALCYFSKNHKKIDCSKNQVYAIDNIENNVFILNNKTTDFEDHIILFTDIENIVFNKYYGDKIIEYKNNIKSTLKSLESILMENPKTTVFNRALKNIRKYPYIKDAKDATKMIFNNAKQFTDCNKNHFEVGLYSKKRLSCIYFESYDDLNLNELEWTLKFILQTDPRQFKILRYNKNDMCIMCGGEDDHGNKERALSKKAKFAKRFLKQDIEEASMYIY